MSPGVGTTASSARSGSAIAAGEAPARPRPQPLTQAIHERCDRERISLSRIKTQAILMHINRLNHRDVQRCRLEPEVAGKCPLSQALELQLHEAQDVRGRPAGRGETDVERGYAMVGRRRPLRASTRKRSSLTLRAPTPSSSIRGATSCRRRSAATRTCSTEKMGSRKDACAW